jgi:hypothetical protein
MNAVFLLWEDYDFDPWPDAFTSVEAAMAASPGDWEECEEGEWQRSEQTPGYSSRWYKVVRRRVTA